MSVYRVLAVRYLLQRWDRAALIVASIALGVATLVSAQILNQCIEAAAQDTTTPAASAELYVTNGEAGVLRSLADELRAANVPGVKAVQPLIYDRVTLPDLDGRAAVLLGAEVSSQLLTSDNALKVKFKPLAETPRLQLLPVVAAIADGQFTKAGELWDRIPARLVVVSRPLYDAWKARTDGKKPFVVRYATRHVECLPVGVIEFEKGSPLAPLGANFIGMSVGQATQVLRPNPPYAAVGGGAGAVAVESAQPPRVNRIDIFLAPGANKDAVVSALSKVTGNRAEVRTPDEHRRSTQEII
ncbi:MAG: hypothetical protein K2V38_24530, partial [Gemmataceae bacterium]|nr:hypothetical protein [Gemmataceae bacterium]